MVWKLEKSTPIFVAGHCGMVGSAIVRALQQQGYHNLIVRTHLELDLTQQNAVSEFFAKHRIECVILAAGKVGGIHANNEYPAEFIYQNLMIECNVIQQAYQCGVKRLLSMGSSCIYPREVPQPMNEDALLAGKLEPTNEPYAIAKIAGIKLCESYNRQYGTDYRSVMPTNLYGPNDNYHPLNSHVIPALIQRFHQAKQQQASEITIWGSGNARREFMHVDDLAAACLFVLNLDKDVYRANTESFVSHLNIGIGEDITIRELAELIAEIADFRGEIFFDSSKPDGTPRKLLNVERINKLGWRASINLKDGLRSAYDWYLKNLDRGQLRA